MKSGSMAKRSVSCLDDLVRQYPGVEKLIFDRRGELFKKVYIYVNAESMYKADFARAVS